MFSVILCNPQMGENIGAAARAMLNFGLTDLRLINPRDGWPNEKAYTMSADALDLMPPVQVFSTLPEAIADLHFILGTTARPRDMVKPRYSPRSAALEIKLRAKNRQKTGILFGAERMGLLNDEVTSCHGTITIATNPEFPSLNLGQSVLLMAYESANALAHQPEDKHSYTGDSFPAPSGEIETFLARLEKELDEGGFFRTASLRPHALRNIRNIFTRSDITEQELRTLHGILTALGRKSPAEQK